MSSISLFSTDSQSTVTQPSDYIHGFPSKNRSQWQFPSPFFDVASQYMPRNIKDTFKWCEHLYCANTIVSQCMERIVKYPLTNLLFEDEVTEVNEKFKGFLLEKQDLKSFEINCGVDLFVYGNCFISIFFPFDRIMRCPKCKMEIPINKVPKLTFKNYEFSGTCYCGYSGRLNRVDRRSMDHEDVNFIRWDPKQIDISYNPITGKYSYYYKIPGDIQARINKGDLNLVNSLPWAFIIAVKEKKVLKFGKDALFHMKQPSLSGLHMEWGLPPTLRVFKLHWYVAILRRANEAIGLDYLTPIRFFFPQPQGGQSGDPGMNLNISRHKNMILSAIKRHRYDPGDAYYVPFPIGYQAIGGEAKALNYMQEIKLANEEIMNGMGFPQEMFYGTMTMQATPTALRLFENTYSYYINSANQLTQWIANQIAKYFDWEKVKVKWAPVTLADDSERKQLLMQLIGAQKVSDDTFLAALGTDFKTETKKTLEQQRIQTELQREFQEKSQYENQAMAGQEGTQAGPGSTPMDMMSKAEQISNEWLQMPEGLRRSAMFNLARQDPTLYAIAKDMMQKMRQQQKNMAYYATQ